MLLDENGGGENEDRENEGKDTVPSANLGYFERGSEDHPAFKAVKRREQMIGSVYGIHEANKLVEQSVSDDVGAYHRSGIADEDNGGNELSYRRTVYVTVADLAALTRCDRIAYDPLDIGCDVYDNELGNEGPPTPAPVVTRATPTKKPTPPITFTRWSP